MRISGFGGPAFIKIRLTRWKHNHSGKCEQYLLINANQANPELCPVVAMLFWLITLSANDIEDGPLFPALKNVHDKFLRSEVDGEKDLGRMSSNTSNTWNRLCSCTPGGVLAECRQQSIRRTRVKWAAGCGGSEHDIKRAGCWKTSSKRFAQHLGVGQTFLEELEILRTSNANFVDLNYVV